MNIPARSPAARSSIQGGIRQFSKLQELQEFTRISPERVWAPGNSSRQAAQSQVSPDLLGMVTGAHNEAIRGGCGLPWVLDHISDENPHILQEFSKLAQ